MSNETYVLVMSWSNHAFQLLVVALAAIALFFLSGCSANIRGQEVRFRPGVRVPGVAVQEGDGESEYLPTYEPEGDTVFFFVTTRY